jgi:UPF0271 protein
MYQLGALDALARAAGTRVRYVKPHGALYNTAADDAAQAGAIASAVAAVDARLPLLGLPDSALAAAAVAAGLDFVTEAFTDRAYLPDGRLVPRGTPGALLTDADTIAARAVQFARDGVAASLCVHGDTPGAVRIAQAVRDALAAAGFELAPFAR